MRMWDPCSRAQHACQAVEMVGTAPLLMASTYAEASPASMGPLMTCAPSRLGCALAKISAVSDASPCAAAAHQAFQPGKMGYKHPFVVHIACS